MTVRRPTKLIIFRIGWPDVLRRTRHGTWYVTIVRIFYTKVRSDRFAPEINFGFTDSNRE